MSKSWVPSLPWGLNTKHTRVPTPILLLKAANCTVQEWRCYLNNYLVSSNNGYLIKHFICANYYRRRWQKDRSKPCCKDCPHLQMKKRRLHWRVILKGDQGSKSLMMSYWHSLRGDRSRREWQAAFRMSLLFSWLSDWKKVEKGTY